MEISIEYFDSLIDTITAVTAVIESIRTSPLKTSVSSVITYQTNNNKTVTRMEMISEYFGSFDKINELYCC